MTPMHGTQSRARSCACSECVAAVETRALLLDYLGPLASVGAYTDPDTHPRQQTIYDALEAMTP